MLPDSRSLWLHTTGDSSRSHAAWVTAISRARSSRSHFSNAACFLGSSNLSPPSLLQPAHIAHSMTLVHMVPSCDIFNT